MKRPELKSKNRKNRLVSRCLALLMVPSIIAALDLSGYEVLTTVSAANDTVLPLAVPEDNNNLLASFDFSGGTLEDISGNGVKAALVDDDHIIGTDGRGNNYLNLTDPDAYLSLSGGILSGLTEMTVEMRVLTKDTNTNWAFFAAPDENSTGDSPTYLGVLFNSQAKVERFANGREHEYDFNGDWTVNTWHTIRVEFAEDSTTLYIDNNAPITRNSDNPLANCLGNNGVLWFGHASWDGGEGFNGYIDDIRISGKSSGETQDKVILSLDFESDNGGVLADKSGNNYEATLENGTLDSYNFFKNENNNTYLDLSGRNGYLSLTKADGSGVLADMAEVTVEMRVKTAASTGAQWAFYAAPDNAYAGSNKYLSVHLTDSTVVARRYSGERPASTPNSNGLSATWETDEWYTVKVVYEAGKTTLSVSKDGKTVDATDLSANIWDCVGGNSVLWFGHSAYNEYFNGCIDDIRIWGTPFSNVKNTAQDVEDRHIITKSVIDPANTTVNMFDYWVFANQTDKDYGLGNRPIEELINGEINKDHLFLFDGSASIWDGDSLELGLWNKYGGEPFLQGESKWGIVQKKLDNGYPRLALDSGWAEPADGTLKGLWTDSKRTESLDYLFDLYTPHAGKASYPDVTGLFRIDDQGYYYFRSQEVFAELNAEQAYDPAQPKTSTGANRITLYDTPWREQYARGQFFPLNDWTDLFYEVNGNVGQWGDQEYQAASGNQPLNHWLGMTIETEFMQPVGGILNRGSGNNGIPMTFRFSGDDDVWIFIDDVLVADIGGIHNRILVDIDFSTGAIEYSKGLPYDGTPGSSFDDVRGKTTLRAMFQDALSDEEFKALQWNGDTFANNTIHTLKFFYLERGNAASNCNIRFNLQEPIVDRIRKVDQNGDPLEGAEFTLYTATPPAGISAGEWWHTASKFSIGTPITKATSNSGGYATLATADGAPIDLSQSTYYILEETGTPAGYRKNPPIVLQYHTTSETLTVVNKYEVGAYASFISEWASSSVFFAEYNNGAFSQDTAVTDAELEKGLAVVVPIVKPRDDTSANPVWRPMYGSNTLGWNTVTPESGSKEDFIKALAEAALMQMADPDPRTQDWYLRWDGVQLKGHLENLPGDATRYVFNSGSSADGNLVTLFLSENALNALGLNGTYENDNDRYAALEKALEGKDANALAALAAGLSDLRILYTDSGFEKNNRTVIYVPNEQRELRVRKVDENGDLRQGAVFALFDNLENAVNGKTTTSPGVKAFGTTGDNGELIFRANIPANSGDGYAEMDWDPSGNNNAAVFYWLKEITAPQGCELNDSLVRVEVGNAGIYANATGFDANGKPLDGYDGIEVEASLGRLNQTLVKYAEGIVDETLKHITATKQTADSSNGALNINSWTDDAESENLIYKVNGYEPVKFTAKDGYIRVMPRQTQEITNVTAKRDKLTDGGTDNGAPIDLDGLFSLINTVVVTDPMLSDTGSLTVRKTVVGSGDLNKSFTFNITLSGERDINGIYNGVSFLNGKASFTLKHGESITFTDLPAGLTYTVTEVEANGYTVSFSGAEGVIAANSTAEAVFINTKNNEPVVPSKPGSTSRPGSTRKPGNTSSPDEPGEPDAPAKPDEPGGSSETNEPIKPSEPVETEEPVKQGEPDDTDEPGGQDETDGSDTFDGSDEPDELNKPGEPDMSDEAGDYRDNPNTGFDMGMGILIIIITLSLTAAVNMLRKRGKYQK